MYKTLHSMTPDYLRSRFVYRDNTSAYRLKLRYYFKLWRLSLDLKSPSEDACLRSKGKSFHKMAPLYKKTYFKIISSRLWKN